MRGTQQAHQVRPHLALCRLDGGDANVTARQPALSRAFAMQPTGYVYMYMRIEPARYGTSSTKSDRAVAHTKHAHRATWQQHWRMVTKPHGCTVAWPHKHKAAWSQGRMITRPHGRMTAWPHGRTFTWSHDHMAAWPQKHRAAWPQDRMFTSPHYHGSHASPVTGRLTGASRARRPGRPPGRLDYELGPWYPCGAAPQPLALRVGLGGQADVGLPEASRRCPLLVTRARTWPLGQAGPPE